MSDKEFSLNVKEIKSSYKKSKHFFMDKRVQLILTAVIFLIILISASVIRTSNLDNLKDMTTGNYSAADPDALYFLRLSHVVLDQGNLNGVDALRAPGLNIPYLKEIAPYTIVGIYKIASVFSQGADLNFIAVISPVIFFILGLIVFFFLCYYLTKSKLVALLSSAFLAFSPAYLFRTMSGVLDHDSIGMLGIFATLLVFAVGSKRYNKSKNKTLLWGGILGLSTAFALGAWAGGVTFLFMIIPLAIIVNYLFNLEGKKEEKEKLILFNITWLVSYVIFTRIIGFAMSDILNRLTNPSSMLVLLVLGFIVVDYLVERNMKKLKMIKEENRVAYSIVAAIILGILLLTLTGNNFFSMVSQIYYKILNPFGYGGRLGSTVSENAQPYLTSWISQIGKGLFALFFAGMVLMGFDFSKKIGSKKHRIYFVAFWIILISGILFSRISQGHILNGENFISQIFYIGGFLLFLIYFVRLYFKNRFEIDKDMILVFSWMLFMLVLSRAAARTIFVATPFACFAASYLLVGLGKRLRKPREDTMKMILWLIFIIGVILAFVSLFGNPLTQSPGTYQILKNQASGIGQAANYQWQYAMEWARDNTGEGDIFVHWWDYGYLVQTLANRKTVSDGGHAAGDSGDHNVGRYILTTPNPITALSYMKTWNVSYLIIDPTDLGKYGAYSKIGSDKDYDRYSAPFALAKEDSQTVETSSGNKFVYQGSSFVDGDISYQDIFIPGPSFTESGQATANAYIIGLLLETSDVSEGRTEIKQPQAVFYYKDKQYQIPIRYVYYQGRIMDFQSGIESTFVLIPKVNEDSLGSIGIDYTGAGMYLSEKVSDSLFANLYLMDDPFNKYPTITLANSEDDYVVNALKQQGAEVGDFVYYGGFRGPLKIWKVEYPQGTETHDEFLQLTSNWEGELDKLF